MSEKVRDPAVAGMFYPADPAELRRMVEGFLAVVPARDGREGVELADQVKPLLILLDIQLPVMDGYAVAEELRNNPSLFDVPIVAVTSFAVVGDQERILAAGCQGYIEKPINPSTFVDDVEKHL